MVSNTDSNEVITIDLKDFLWYLLKRWKIVAVVTGILIFVMFVYAFIIATPIYESTAQIYVVSPSDSVLNLASFQIGSYLASDYQLVFDTWEVNQQVIQNLNLPYSMGELKRMRAITNPSNTRALFITVQSPNAKEAAAIANEYASVASKYISDTLLSDEPTLLSMALESVEPVEPRKKQLLALAAAAGIFLSVVALFVIFVLDDKIKTIQDVQKTTGVAPMGIIPISNNKGRR